MKTPYIILISVGTALVQGVLALITSVTGVLYLISTLSSMDIF